MHRTAGGQPRPWEPTASQSVHGQKMAWLFHCQPSLVSHEHCQSMDSPANGERTDSPWVAPMPSPQLTYEQPGLLQAQYMAI